jgi:hypothetical protein
MAGVYSKAYQTVRAGRTREDEAIAFFGKNKIATPARVTSFNSVGGQKQPTVVEDPNEFVGKNVDLGGVKSTKRNKGAYRPPTVNIS